MNNIYECQHLTVSNDLAILAAAYDKLCLLVEDLYMSLYAFHLGQIIPNPG